MAELKRDEIKYIRDISKSAYRKDSECRICGSTEELQFHHFYSMTLLWNKWKRDNKVIITCIDDILKYREQFKQDCYTHIYEDTVTLCKFHHMEKLHKVYGKVPTLATAEKQKRWIEKQRQKHIDKIS